MTATPTGTVSSGAAAPGAAVTATETTGVSRSTQTSAEGVYSLPFLNPGTYRVDISKDGFKKFTEDNFELDVELSPISAKLLQYIPAPNIIVAGAPPLTLNYVFPAPTRYSSNSIDGRADRTFNEKSNKEQDLINAL